MSAGLMFTFSAATMSAFAVMHGIKAVQDEDTTQFWLASISAGVAAVLWRVSL